ncbi:hypothetical protein CTEN210_06631 [Chaetoceros tenuissimus]|uniref:Uncharacterized protein n=1 Tax=Chaetoceros tenuissimus TaxID=426638 RepID=A0AAD3CSA5_9STRA|nr:hypothetical protein CTEN210_06631 [Chaetoceros tenuissimus]
MHDDVLFIGPWAFYYCQDLLFVRLSRNLEFMGHGAFCACYNLPSMFIPPSCEEINGWVFEGCKHLIILNIPRNTELGRDKLISRTKLINKFPFEIDEDSAGPWRKIFVFGKSVIFREKYEKAILRHGPGEYDYDSDTGEDVNEWIKNINTGTEYFLHRLCCSTYENETLPISEAIYQAVKEQGPQVLQVKNKIGITPLKYLEENPYLENIDEMKMLKRFSVRCHCKKVMR